MNAYKIETERLIIRCYDTKDAHKLKLAIDESIEHLIRWMPWAKNEPQTIEEKVKLLTIFRKDFDLDKDYTYGIFDKEEKILIGSTGLHTRQGENILEIGYWISKNHINNGYASESTKALTKVGFEILKQHRMEIHCDPQNIRSYKIPEKIGYKLETKLKKTTAANVKEAMIWYMLKEDYERHNLKNIDIKVLNSLNEQIY